MAVNNPYFDEKEVRKAINQLFQNGDVFEVRIIGKGANKQQPSAYFTDAEVLIEQLRHQALKGSNVYITLNQLKNAVYSRVQRDQFVPGESTTSASDVEGYRWLFVDIDPNKPANVSSSDEELKYAFNKAKAVASHLQQLGFERPVKAVSGNGAHLLYRIRLAKTNENSELLKRCLEVLATLFDDENVKIDTVNYNPARVCKLYGTLAQKGSNTSERPHRMSKIIGEVFEPRTTDIEYLRKLANEIPEEKPQRANRYNNYNANAFDLEEWLTKYNIGFKKTETSMGEKFTLDFCPFDASHKAPDSMVFRYSNGAVNFKCLHNSCANKKWQDLRLMYEPDAYEYNDADRRIEEGWKQHNRERKEQPLEISEDDVPMFQTAEMILSKPQPEREFIRTGITKLDKQLRGLEKTKISVISGLRASGKSTLLSEVILNAVQDDHTVVAYSGELSDTSFMNWLTLQAAGKSGVEKTAKYEGYFFVPNEVQKKIAAWLGERLWLYNNNKFATLDDMMTGLQQKCIKTKADLLIIDNLMALDVGARNRTNEYDAQTRFVWELKRLAEKCNVHAILVAHPRKTQDFLRLNDIAGSSNIANIIDNAFIVHRVNEDFKRLSKLTFKWGDNHYLFQSECTNCIEIAKDRDRGTCDFFIDLYYEAETKRLKNYKAENIVYKWQGDEPVTEPKQMDINDWQTVENEEEIPF